MVSVIFYYSLFSYTNLIRYHTFTEAPIENIQPQPQPQPQPIITESPATTSTIPTTDHPFTEAPIETQTVTAPSIFPITTKATITVLSPYRALIIVKYFCSFSPTFDTPLICDCETFKLSCNDLISTSNVNVTTFVMELGAFYNKKFNCRILMELCIAILNHELKIITAPTNLPTTTTEKPLTETTTRIPQPQTQNQSVLVSVPLPTTVTITTDTLPTESGTEEPTESSGPTIELPHIVDEEADEGRLREVCLSFNKDIMNYHHEINEMKMENCMCINHISLCVMLRNGSTFHNICNHILQHQTPLQPHLSAPKECTCSKFRNTCRLIQASSAVFSRASLQLQITLLALAIMSMFVISR